MVPKRADELTDGGSLYWVIRGEVMCRERILDIRPFTDKDGIGRCRLVLDGKSCWSSRGPFGPFQGWRYLAVADAPRDLDRAAPGAKDMPEALRRELRGTGVACRAAPPQTRTAILSMSRVLPSRAATSSRIGPSLPSDRRQRLGMARLEIVERKPRPLDRLAALGQHAGDGAACGDLGAGDPQHAVEHRRNRALVGREVGVARRHGEAVALAHRRSRR